MLGPAGLTPQPATAITQALDRLFFLALSPKPESSSWCTLPPVTLLCLNASAGILHNQEAQWLTYTTHASLVNEKVCDIPLDHDVQTCFWTWAQTGWSRPFYNNSWTDSLTGVYSRWHRCSLFFTNTLGEWDLKINPVCKWIQVNLWRCLVLPVQW